MMNLGEVWERVTARRYTRMLETEVERLRAENRALVNSIIGIAGIPPLKIDVEIETEQKRRRRLEMVKQGVFGAKPASEAERGGVQEDRARADRAARARGFMLPLNRLRRRSWQQIGRMLEMEEVRKLGHRESAVTMQPAVRS